MGVDGFEVAGRNQEVSADAHARLAAIRLTTETNNLVAMGNSDFHGRRTAHYQWNATEGRDGEGFDAVFWGAVSGRDRAVDVMTMESTTPPVWAQGVLAPPFTLVSYLRKMPLGGRVVWILVLLLAGLWTRNRWSREPGGVG